MTRDYIRPEQASGIRLGDSQIPRNRLFRFSGLGLSIPQTMLQSIIRETSRQSWNFVKSVATPFRIATAANVATCAGYAGTMLIPSRPQGIPGHTVSFPGWWIKYSPVTYIDKKLMHARYAISVCTAYLHKIGMTLQQYLARSFKTATYTALALAGIVFVSVAAWQYFSKRKTSAPARIYTTSSSPPSLPERGKGENAETAAQYIERLPTFDFARPNTGGVVKSGVHHPNTLHRIIAHGGHILMPTKYTRHAHAVVYQGKQFTPITFPYFFPEHCVQVSRTPVDLEWEILTPHYVPAVGVPSPLPRRCVVNSMVFIDDGLTVTNLSKCQSVPRKHIDAIAARLASSTQDEAHLYDVALSFLRSKLTAEKVAVTDHAEWALFLLARMNEDSATIAPSIRPNVAIGSSAITRILYSFWNLVKGVDRSSSYPRFVPGSLPAPSYTVYSVAENVEAQEPIRPETANPFPDVRPADVSTVPSEHVSPAGSGGHERSDVHGEEGAGETTSTPPHVDRETAGQQVTTDVVARTSTGNGVPPETNPVPPAAGLECPLVSNARVDRSAGNNRVVPPDESGVAAQIVGDSTLYILPNPRTTGGWDAFLERGEHEKLVLFGCQHHIALSVARCRDKRLSAWSFLARFAKSGGAPECSNNAEGISCIGACPSRVAEISERNKGKTPPASTIREMGQEVPAQQAEGAASREGGGFRRRRTNRQRRNRQMLSQN